MYKIAVFDMDGTILDTIDDLHAAINHTLKNLGFPERGRDEFRTFIGDGQRILVKRSLPEGAQDGETLQRVIDLYAPYYAAHADILTTIYDGVFEAIAKMREAGMKIAIFTNKPHAPAVALAEKYFPGMIDFVFGQRADIPRKPDPAGLFVILDELQISKEECIYIGDSDVDMQTAKNANVTAIGVTWGYNTRDEIERAGGRMIIDDALQLADLILEANTNGESI